MHQSRLKAKTPEAKANLGAIRRCEEAYFAERHVYVGNQPPTPVADRRGVSKKVSWVSSTRFDLLGFIPEGCVYCSYSLEGADLSKDGFVAKAICDFDGDGKVFIYTVTNETAEIVHTGERF